MLYPGTAIDSRITVVSDHVFGKPKGDSFSNPAFERFLIKNNICELFLCGLDAEFCIYHTALGAANRHYKVNIISDAITTKDLNKMEKLLKKYTKRGFTLLQSEEI
jgi:nicotinamidase/pyrazinamidase